MMIGQEVANKLIKYIEWGSTIDSANFPVVDLPPKYGKNTERLCNTHLNQPGVLGEILAVLKDINVHAQGLATYDDIGYLVILLDEKASAEVKDTIANLSTSIRTRICSQERLQENMV